MTLAQDLELLDDVDAILEKIEQVPEKIEFPKTDPPSADALTDRERQAWRLKKLRPREDAVRPLLADFGKLRPRLLGLAHRYLEDPSDLLLEDHKRLWWCYVHGGDPQDGFAIGAPCCPWACTGWRNAARKELRDIREAPLKQAALLREAVAPSADPPDLVKHPVCVKIRKALRDGPRTLKLIETSTGEKRRTISKFLKLMRHAGYVEPVSNRGPWMLTDAGRKLPMS